jgi:predicted nucleic acid-binding protein
VSDPSPTPLIVDTSVLTAITRTDPGVIGLMQIFDARSQPLVIPALAITGASLDAHSEDIDDLLAGLEMLETVTVASLHGARRAAKVARIIDDTGLTTWDAHVAAVAAASKCAILTLDAANWRQVSGAFDPPLQIVEIADTDEG